MRKFLAFGICFLLICSILIPISLGYDIKTVKQQPVSYNLGNTFYVGGSGEGNYTKIQDAIDNASDGDTVFVYKGTYNERIKINKSVNLNGEDRENTFINGSPKLVTIIIDANNIDLTGFTIQTPGLSQLWRRGIIVYNDSKNIKIYNNIISKNYFGIELNDIEGKVDVRIYDNIIIENKYGIDGDGDRDSIVEIYNNNFVNNEVGISVYTNYSVHNNLVSENSIGIRVRIGLTSLIYNNHIEKNKIGIRVLLCGGTQIYENNFIDNDIQACLLKYAYIVFDVKFFEAIKFLRLSKQKWRNNYWDNWNSEIPKPIFGLSSIFFVIWIIFPFRPCPVPIPFPYPYFEFDWHPTQKPYDIEV